MLSYTAVKREIKYTMYYIRIKTLCCVLMLSSIVLYLYCIHKLKIFRSLIVYTNECCCIFAKCIRFSDFFSNLDFIFIIICLSYVIYIMNDIFIIMFEYVNICITGTCNFVSAITIFINMYFTYYTIECTCLQEKCF